MTRSLVTVSPDVEVVGIRDVLRSLVEQLWREHDLEARETARGLLTSDRPHSA